VARGWESKAIEAQIEEGKQRMDEPSRPANSPEARARQQRFESLRLSRSRLLDQLERARHKAHREVLLNGLRVIEKEMEEIAAE
jgi:hypothetical protein